MMKRGTPRFFSRFWAHSEAVSRFIKNDEEGHPRLRFWAHSEAVSRNAKNGAEGHRALVKHGNARAGERHQLVGHQMNEQVRHRARSPERVLTPLILGTRSVGKPAMKLWRR